MSSEVISKNEEKRLLELGREVFASSFPNPERKGCPEPGALKRIAIGEGLANKDEEQWISHCSRCSPCFREFGEFRRAFVRQRRLRRLCAAAIIIVAVCVGIWLAMNHDVRRSSETSIAGNVQSESAIQNAVLDLRAWSAVRSDQAAPKPSGKPLKLHRGLLALAIYLPMGSPPGKYEIEIQRSQGETLLKVAGTAGVTSGNTILSARVDLRQLQSGQYSLAIRQPPWEWHDYPIALW